MIAADVLVAETLKSRAAMRERLRVELRARLALSIGHHLEQHGFTPDAARDLADEVVFGVVETLDWHTNGYRRRVAETELAEP